MANEQNAEVSLDAVSGVTLGCLCTYVQEFGTPHQKKETLVIIEHIRNILTCDANLDEKELKETVNWKELRQRLYSISGDWLWLHAANHWKSKVAPQMFIPSDLMEKALFVERLDDEKKAITSATSSSTNLTVKINENIDQDHSSNLDMTDYDHDERDNYFESDNRRLEYTATDILNDPSLLEGIPN